jgi:hypothetical protein
VLLVTENVFVIVDDANNMPIVDALPVLGELNVLPVMLSESVVTPSKKNPRRVAVVAVPACDDCSLLVMLTTQPKNDPLRTTVALLKWLLVTARVQVAVVVAVWFEVTRRVAPEANTLDTTEAVLFSSASTMVMATLAFTLALVMVTPDELLAVYVVSAAMMPVMICVPAAQCCARRLITTSAVMVRLLLAHLGCTPDVGVE